MAVRPAHALVEERTAGGRADPPSVTCETAPQLTATVPSRRRRRAGVVALVTASVLTLGVGGATAGSQIVHRNDNGVIVVEGQQLRVIYHGELVSQGVYADLTDRGQALFTATDVDTARELGAMRAFDTQVQLDAYDRAYLAWQADKRAGASVGRWTELAPLAWSPGS